MQASVWHLVWGPPEEFERLIIERLQRSFQGKLIGLERFLPDVGRLLGINHLEDPAACGIAVDLDLHRHSVARHALAERGVDEVWLVAVKVVDVCVDPVNRATGAALTPPVGGVCRLFVRVSRLFVQICSYFVLRQSSSAAITRRRRAPVEPDPVADRHASNEAAATAIYLSGPSNLSARSGRSDRKGRLSAPGNCRYSQRLFHRVAR